MNKKYFAIVLSFILIATLFVACKKDDKKTDETTTNETTTVAFDESATITTRENGEAYITNMYGDEIPVTRSEDGFYDDISSLFTQVADENTIPVINETMKDEISEKQTTDKVEDSNTTQGNESQTAGAVENIQTTTKVEETNKTEPSTDNKNIVDIGDGKEQYEAEISWDEIVAASKK